MGQNRRLSHGPQLTVAGEEQVGFARWPFLHPKVVLRNSQALSALTEVCKCVLKSYLNTLSVEKHRFS